MPCLALLEAELNSGQKHRRVEAEPLATALQSYMHKAEGRSWRAGRALVKLSKVTEWAIEMPKILCNSANRGNPLPNAYPEIVSTVL